VGGDEDVVEDVLPVGLGEVLRVLGYGTLEELEGLRGDGVAGVVGEGEEEKEVVHVYRVEECVEGEWGVGGGELRRVQES